MNIELVSTIGIELIGAAVVFGVIKQKTETNQKEIEEIKAKHNQEIQTVREEFHREIIEIKNKQSDSDNLLHELKEMMGRIDSNVNLLIHGKIKTGEN